ncbi:MAG: SCO family protein [Proteobacteria bacterium]|nr:SCO family protein [Pseudomonadota bacterium]
MLWTALFVPASGLAHGDYQHGPLAAIDNSPSVASKGLHLPDVRVLDQNGRELRFDSDLVRDKIVVVSFIYTTCTAICSPMTAGLKRARDLLDPALAGRVRFISVSVDPQHDTPGALKAFADRHGIDGDWRFVTGAPASLRQIRKAFSAATTRKEDHTPLIVIGDASRRAWIRKHGLAPPEAIVEAIDKMASP